MGKKPEKAPRWMGGTDIGEVLKNRTVPREVRERLKERIANGQVRVPEAGKDYPVTSWEERLLDERGFPTSTGPGELFDVYRLIVSCGHGMDFLLPHALTDEARGNILLDLSAKARLLLCGSCAREWEEKHGKPFRL